MKQKVESRNPWAWVPSLYFTEGIPYVLVITVSVIMYKRLGMSNTDIALYTSWLYLPWVIKPFWGPLVDLIKTKRLWIIVMQLFVGAGLAGIAFTIPADNYIRYTLAFFWLLAFSSATHDIAADGFYMLALDQHTQTFFVGIRSTFYRFAMITGQGLLIMLAGHLETSTGLPPIDIQIHSKSEAQTVQHFQPDSIIFPSAKEFSVLCSQRQLTVEIKTFPKAAADSLIKLAKDWNIKNNFYAEEKVIKDTSWWERNVTFPIDQWVKKIAADQPVKPKISGNIAYVFFKLNEAPTGKYIVTFTWESGDKSISLAEGGRYTFTSENWNIPAVAAIQLDSRLKSESSSDFQIRSGNFAAAWNYTFIGICAIFLLFAVYHKFILPYPASDKASLQEVNLKNFIREFLTTFKLFFQRDRIWLMIAFLLIYRFGEAQLVKMASPFLLDPRDIGGLGLTTGQVGFVYGTVGILALTIGGLTGGFLAAKNGLRFWLWWMFLAINIPHILYIYLSFAQPSNFIIINLCVAGEQFGYGFGFTAYMLYMIYISDGPYKTAHYALTTGFMALSMMIPGMFSGYIQAITGYKLFFVWILLTMLPGLFIVLALRKTINPDFGKKAVK
jgi:PAT family beta-lactamase induction signal transducer AmpG